MRRVWRGVRGPYNKNAVRCACGKPLHGTSRKLGVCARCEMTGVRRVVAEPILF